MSMKLPQFYPYSATDYKTVDYGTESGCRVLCGMIKNAWRKAGHEHVTAEPVHGICRGPRGGEFVRYQVRTNLINGLPPGRS